MIKGEISFQIWAQDNSSFQIIKKIPSKKAS